jgi:hypothetical protein
MIDDSEKIPFFAGHSASSLSVGNDGETLQQLVETFGRKFCGVLSLPACSPAVAAAEDDAFLGYAIDSFSKGSL